MFEGKSIVELDAIAEDLKEARREAVAREKEEANEAIRQSLKALDKGTPVRVLFKGDEAEAKFLTLTTKRFTVELDGVKRSIQMDKFIDVVA